LPIPALEVLLARAMKFGIFSTTYKLLLSEALQL